jgi:hypothetical protein
MTRKKRVKRKPAIPAAKYMFVGPDGSKHILSKDDYDIIMAMEKEMAKPVVIEPVAPVLSEGQRLANSLLNVLIAAAELKRIEKAERKHPNLVNHSAAGAAGGAVSALLFNPGTVGVATAGGGTAMSAGIVAMGPFALIGAGLGAAVWLVKAL